MPRNPIRLCADWFAAQIDRFKFYLWRRECAGMLRHWFGFEASNAWRYSRYLEPHYRAGATPEDAIEKALGD